MSDIERLLSEHPGPWQVVAGREGRYIEDARARRVFTDWEPMGLLEALVAAVNARAE